jgi:hypothetical protein
MMRGGAIAMTVLLTGCDLLFSIDHLDDADAGIGDGVSIDATCLGIGLLSGICVEGGGDIALTTAINTTGDGRCRKVPQDNGPTLCVIDGERISVSEFVQVTGDSPLVLIATKSVAITGAIDASSRAGRVGAGAQLGCAGGVGTNGGTGGGGGAGGSFGFIGAGGAAGQQGGFTTSPGGMAKPVVPQTAVVGGCGGGSGGVAGAASPAAPGAGGGAIYVIAGDMIHLAATASINASGGGGAGGTTAGGGGAGGGAGGFIALDAPMIVLDGLVFARGGGGGGAGGSSTGGYAGADPSSPTTGTPGGAAGANGGRGGDGCGAPAGQQGGNAYSSAYGGGGGGGGCGRIRLYGTLTGMGTLNPAPT